MHAIEGLADSSNDIFLELATTKALIIKEMALVNKIIKTKPIKTCTVFSEQFVKQRLSEIESYDEIRLITHTES